MAVVSYCSYTDVQGLTGKSYSDSPASTPTRTFINNRIKFRSSQLNAKLKQAGYITPAVQASHPEAYEICLGLVAGIVAYDAENSLYRDDRTGNKRSARIGEWRQEWESFLKQLNGLKDDPDGRDTILPDLTLDTSSNRFPSSYCQENSTDEDMDSVFEHDMEF